MKSKSKVAAGLLGIFLGWAGVHNFYLGYIGKGILQAGLYLACWVLIVLAYILLIFSAAVVPLILSMICSLLSLCISIPMLIWIIIEVVKIFSGKTCDANGNPLH